MDVSIKSDNLKKVVSCASRATSSKVVQPILNNILLSSKNGSLTVQATDLDISIECNLEADVLKPGKVCLPSKKLDEIVNRLPGDEVKISIDKNQLANILCNKSKFQVNGVSPEEFPNISSNLEKEIKYEISGDELLRAISLTSFATSRFETSSVLSGVNFEVRGGEFEIGATDGSRLARYEGKLKSTEKGSKARESVVIPGRTLLELEKLITIFKSNDSTVSFSFSSGQATFQNNDFSITSRLVNGPFPSYDKLIPKEQSNKAVISKVELLSALERVSILANERTSVIKISFSKGSKTVLLSANSPDYGNATDEIEVEYSGDEMEIAFNYKYLSEVLRNLVVEKILLELENSLSPILLKISEKVDYGYTYLVMPVQMR